ncbi:RNA polymerase sigma factor [Primorskyibacter flagellatus]|uniref:RNA polymerase sigma factor n=1 Tax=Primorskyibacter flagellatus TaxID=1387277 RepID=A0A917A867_9RHOB|nr:sigma-70 family RNA polymerase sigma factor [Primorskyibacter flagellatus]GGE34190.1 RNA polymerase sigma factor [Primorskyibacter flagellatus]
MPDRNQHWSDLLRRANRGDGAAYAAFLAEVAPVVRTICRQRSGGAEDVEDIVQEVLLAVHAKRHTWREADPVTPWLYAIARYKTADAGRRRRGQGGQVPIETVAEVLPEETGDTTAARDLAQLLGRIDTHSAGIVRSVGIEGQSAGEVGARLGMTEGAVRVAYHRALVKLKDLAGAEADRAD